MVFQKAEIVGAYLTSGGKMFHGAALTAEKALFLDPKIL